MSFAISGAFYASHKLDDEVNVLEIAGFLYKICCAEILYISGHQITTIFLLTF